LANHSASVHGGSLFASYYVGLSVQQTNISASHAQGSGGALYVIFPVQVQSRLQLYQAALFNNSAGYDGAAVFAKGTVVDAIHSTFQLNRAIKGGGGGCFFDLSDFSNHSIGSTFISNAAVYGPDVASPCCYLQLMNETAYANITQLSSSQRPITPPVRVQAFDCYHQLVSADLGPAAVVNAGQLSELNGITTQRLINGTAVFSDLSVRTQKSSIVLYLSALFVPDIQSATVVLKVSPCPAGMKVEPDMSQGQRAVLDAPAVR